MSNFSVILAAAGKSQRFCQSDTGESETKKPFTDLDGKAVWIHSAELFHQLPSVGQLIVVISPDDHDEFVARFRSEIESMGIQIALGGEERADSIENSLRLVREDCDFVAIHDAARPCIDVELVNSVFESAIQTGAAIPAVPVHSTVKRSLDGCKIEETVDRTGLYLAQTPQVFRRALIQSVYADRGDENPTDEAHLLELKGHTVSLVAGSALNIKITTKADLALAKAGIEWLKKR